MNIPLSPCVPENLVSRDGFGGPVPPQPAHLQTQAEYGAYSRDSSRFPRRRPHIYTVSRHRASPNFIGPRKCVPMAFTANSHWHRSGSPQGCSSTVMGAVFSGFIMDHFFYAPLFSHTHYWYVVDMRDTKSIEGSARRTLNN